MPVVCQCTRKPKQRFLTRISLNLTKSHRGDLGNIQVPPVGLIHQTAFSILADHGTPRDPYVSRDWLLNSHVTFRLTRVGVEGRGHVLSSENCFGNEMCRIVVGTGRWPSSARAPFKARRSSPNCSVAGENSSRHRPLRTLKDFTPDPIWCLTVNFETISFFF